MNHPSDRQSELLVALVAGATGFWGVIEIRYEDSRPVLIKRTTTENLRSTRNDKYTPSS